MAVRTVVLLLLAASMVAGRSVFNFDFGYMFHLGEVGPSVSCNATDFTENITGTQCYGLAEASATDIESCACACERSRTCLLWQWCDSQACGNPGSCWIGTDCSNNVSNPWISYRRKPGPPPPPPGCSDDSNPCAKNYDDSAWRTVNVPHDFIIEGNFTPSADRSHGYLPFNTSWYRKHFSVGSEFSSSLISLEFDGVYRNSDFWLNGVYLGHHESGYTSFHFYIHNLTDPKTGLPVLQYGDAVNVLSVHVDALSDQEGWFYEGGGIYRHTRMVVTDNVCIVHWGVYGPSAITGNISSPSGPDGRQTASSATVFAQTDIANALTSSVDYTLITSVITADGQVVGQQRSTGTLSSGGWARIHQNINLNDVILWNVAEPYMYTLASELTAGSSQADALNTSIGIRQTYFDPNHGHMLNGYSVKLKGLSMHQDFAGCGVAVPDRVNEFRVKSLRDMGATGWRTAHNPVNIELLDFTDRYGMLVMSENRFINRGVQPLSAYRPSYFVTDSPTAQIRALARQEKYSDVGPDVADPELLQDCQDMVLRDRNHPSIVIWSLCNEGGCEQGAWYGGVIAAQFKEAISWADTFRPVTGNTEWGVDSPDTFTTVVDVAAFSYNYGAYEVWHNYHPWKPVYGGESASCVSDRGYYLPTNHTTGFVNADDEGCVRSAWQDAGTKDYVAGNFAWTGFDYKGEPTPMDWPCINSHFGIIDIAGFPKDSYYYYAAWWANNASALFISPRDWTAPVPVGKTVTVVVYTMAPTVELFVNGVSFGNRSVPFLGYAEWDNIVFQPGTISAKGYNSNGQVQAEESISSAGRATALKLWVEPVGESYATLKADGQDTALVGIAIVDDNGNVVVPANNQLSFNISGPAVIYGTGNGNPSDHTPDKCGVMSPWNAPCTRPAFMGLARLVIQADRQPGTALVTVTSPGLRSATISIPIEQGRPLP